MTMKTFALFCICSALMAAAVRADDFHLVETTMYGDPLVPTGAPATNCIYVLLLPIHDGGSVVINPVVLRKFDPKEIGQIIDGAVARGFLPKGSVLHFDAGPELQRPPEGAIKALMDSCKKAGITVSVSQSA